MVAADWWVWTWYQRPYIKYIRSLLLYLLRTDVIMSMMLLVTSTYIFFIQQRHGLSLIYKWHLQTVQKDNISQEDNIYQAVHVYRSFVEFELWATVQKKVMGKNTEKEDDSYVLLFYGGDLFVPCNDFGNIRRVISRLRFLKKFLCRDQLEHRNCKCKLLILCHSIFSDTASVYLSDLHVYSLSRQLRSIPDSFMCIPHIKTKTSGHRSFSHATPSVWNSLPREIRHVQSTTAFKM